MSTAGAHKSLSKGETDYFNRVGKKCVHSQCSPFIAN